MLGGLGACWAGWGLEIGHDIDFGVLEYYTEVYWVPNIKHVHRKVPLRDLELSPYFPDSTQSYTCGHVEFDEGRMLR